MRGVWRRGKAGSSKDPPDSLPTPSLPPVMMREYSWFVGRGVGDLPLLDFHVEASVFGFIMILRSWEGDDGLGHGGRGSVIRFVFYCKSF